MPFENLRVVFVSIDVIMMLIWRELYVNRHVFTWLQLNHVIMRSNLQTLFNPFLTTVLSYFFLCSMKSQQIRVDSSWQTIVPHTSHCFLDLVKLSFTAFVAPTSHFSHRDLSKTFSMLCITAVSNPLFCLYQANFLDTKLFCCWL